MNKEEVKEVLGYCLNSDSSISCMECKFFDFADCRDELIKCAIKLIDKQEAEIESLKAENERLIADNTALEIWNEFYTVENEALKSEKANLMRTLEEGGEEIELARKETAKEILSDLYFNLQSSVQGKVTRSNDYYNVDGWIKKISEEYGVEVEE